VPVCPQAAAEIGDAEAILEAGDGAVVGEVLETGRVVLAPVAVSSVLPQPVAMAAIVAMSSTIDTSRANVGSTII